MKNNITDKDIIVQGKDPFEEYNRETDPSK